MWGSFSLLGRIDDKWARILVPAFFCLIGAIWILAGRHAIRTRKTEGRFGFVPWLIALLIDLFKERGPYSGTEAVVCGWISVVAGCILALAAIISLVFGFGWL